MSACEASSLIKRATTDGYRVEPKKSDKVERKHRYKSVNLTTNFKVVTINKHDKVISKHIPSPQDHNKNERSTSISPDKVERKQRYKSVESYDNFRLWSKSDDLYSLAEYKSLTISRCFSLVFYINLFFYRSMVFGKHFIFSVIRIFGVRLRSPKVVNSDIWTVRRHDQLMRKLVRIKQLQNPHCFSNNPLLHRHDRWRRPAERMGYPTAKWLVG